MEYTTFTDWVQWRINDCAKSGGVVWSLNEYKHDYRTYLAINVKPYDKKLAKQLSEELKKITKLDEMGVDIK